MGQKRGSWHKHYGCKANRAFPGNLDDKSEKWAHTQEATWAPRCSQTCVLRILHTCLDWVGPKLPHGCAGGRHWFSIMLLWVQSPDLILLEFLSLTPSLHIQGYTHFCLAPWSPWKRRTISTVCWIRSRTPWSTWWPKQAWLFSSSTGAWPSSSSSSPTSGTWGEVSPGSHRRDVRRASLQAYAAAGPRRPDAGTQVACREAVPGVL